MSAGAAAAAAAAIRNDALFRPAEGENVKRLEGPVPAAASGVEDGSWDRKVQRAVRSMGQILMRGGDGGWQWDIFCGCRTMSARA